MVFWDRFYEGNIDEIIIFDRSLTESDLTYCFLGLNILMIYLVIINSIQVVATFYLIILESKAWCNSGATWSEDVYVPNY